MENEIAAVKKEVLDIIDAANEGGIIPSVYILAPYEASVDLTITKDTEKVKQVLNGLVPNGGTENVFTALRVIEKYPFLFSLKSLQFSSNSHIYYQYLGYFVKCSRFY